MNNRFLFSVISVCLLFVSAVPCDVLAQTSKTGKPTVPITRAGLDKAFLDSYEKWQLVLEDGTVIRDSDLSITHREEEEKRLDVTWQSGNTFSVHVEWHKDDQGVWLGEFSYSGFEHKSFVKQIAFPRLRFPSAQQAVPYVCGGYCIGYGGTFTKGSKGFPVISGVPILAATVTDRLTVGLHLRDTERYAGKAFQLARENDALIVSGLYHPGHGSSIPESGKVPYRYGYKPTEGGWFGVAQDYRRWSEKQEWSRPKTTPDKLRNIGLWVWNRGAITNVVPPTLELQKRLGKEIPVALDWYWWHHNPYDTDYPDFWPPREGEAAFRNAVADLHRHGIYSQVYVNGVCWDRHTASWCPDAEKSAVVKKDGKIFGHVFNKYNKHELVTMCGENTVFFNRLGGVIDKLAATGLDGVYTDMIGGATLNPCYNPAHHHLKGYGNFQAKGFRAFIQSIKERHPNLVLSTEFASETYMDLFDASIICNTISNERMGGWLDKIYPVFPAVHHGHGYALFGNYAHPDGSMPWDPLWPPEDKWKAERDWNSLYPVQFYYELGRTVVWGCQPMVCNVKMDVFTDPRHVPVLDFMLEAAQFYHANLAYLYDGVMLSPEDFSCDEIDVSFCQRMIFTKESLMKTLVRRLPAVLHSAWQAPDGKTALFLCNPTAEPRTWRYRNQSGTIPPHSFQKIGSRQ
ncbi:MAG: hypothetical protein IKR48_08965 [Kiritimatiellae bacterium]|nr:hypothetical protein [Kiritimatiellia bacterium]